MLTVGCIYRGCDGESYEYLGKRGFGDEFRDIESSRHMIAFKAYEVDDKIEWGYTTKAFDCEESYVVVDADDNNIIGQIQNITETICKKYCRYTQFLGINLDDENEKDNELWTKFCSGCPLQKLML